MRRRVEGRREGREGGRETGREFERGRFVGSGEERGERAEETKKPVWPRGTNLEVSLEIAQSRKYPRREREHTKRSPARCWRGGRSEDDK